MMPDSHDSEDLVNDVFLAAVEKLHEFDATGFRKRDENRATLA